MMVGILQFELLIRGSESLKDKRRVIRSLKDRLHREHLVSVAEVGLLDNPRAARLGLALPDDLPTADVLVSISPEQRETPSMHGLQAAARHSRRKAGDLVSMRKVPELAFRLDRSLKKQAEVLQAISRAAADTAGRS